ncbi:hypothetical protein C0993_009475 [Termitomyces sp. T159_Od127]|nr:hypothetical protein C0993_009475 [Termitomyces sp. T159_Od127]
MSKRELEQLNGATEIEGPRTKRRKETAAVFTDVEATHSDPVTEGGDESVSGARKEDVYELGLKMYDAVKDAVNKEGRTLSLVFQRRPSKRQYPDYYRIIQHPIALEDIKKQLDNGSYKTLEAVKQDFELCFNNAKQYNMKESEIYKDAKDLLKLVNKTYNKLIPQADGGEAGDGEGKKSKPPNLTRLIKSRLQKLIEKTDDSGRLLSLEFMELPSKKEWPSYYKLIKKPQCLENIFKRIKRKEYATSSDFAADVELVFENAMTFNQEHTGIWEDAKALRDYFRVLLTDLPPPFEVPQYVAAKPRIKIKPQPSQSSVSLTIPAVTQPSTSSASTSQTLRIPAVKHAKTSPASTPVTPAVPLPAATSTPPPQATTTVPATATSAPAPHLNTTFSHYPNASYVPPTPTPAAPTASTSTSTSTTNLTTNPVVQPHSASNSPAPPLHPSHQLKAVSLVVQPRGRALNLDYEDGVKCWALRLLPGETEVHVSQVTFMGDEEDESSEEEEEEEEEEEDTEGVAVNGRKRVRTRGRGRPKATARTKGKTSSAKKKKQKIGPVQVKLNGVIVKEQEDESGQWNVSPAVGTSTIENTGEFRHHDSRGSRSTQGNREGPNIRSDSGSRGPRRSTASSPIDHGWGLPHKEAAGQLDKHGSGSSKRSVNQPVSSRTTSAFLDNVWGTSSSNITGGNRDTSDAWGNANNGWGTDAVHDKGGASKGDTSVWGPSSSISVGWASAGTARIDKGWGSEGSNVGWPLKDETDKGNAASPKNSPANDLNIGDRGWNTSTIDWKTREKPPDPRRAVPPLRPAGIPKENSRSSTPQTSQPEDSPMPAPLPQRLDFPGRKSSSSTPILSPIMDRKGTPLKVKTKGIDISESVSSAVPNSARPRDLHLNRSRIQLNTIRYTSQAVRLRLDLNSALADVERWKRLRSSTQFTRATPLTQNIINDKRLAYGQNVKELENKLHATIRHLADQPELPTQADLVSAEEDHQRLIEYTAQLQDWIGGLKTSCRDLLSPKTSSPVSPPVTERPKHPNEIVWDQIETLVQSVDENIGFIEEVLYANKDIRGNVASSVTGICADHDAKRLSGAKDKAESLMKEAQGVGSDLEVLVTETAAIMIAIHDNGLALEKLNAELEDHQNANQQLAAYLQQLEQWKEEDNVRIERLKQQIKSLHTKQPPSRLPFDQEELKERLKKYTLDKMTGQVNSLCHIIQQVAKDNSRTFEGEILKELEPILEATNEVCRRAEAITSRFPIPS